MNTIRERQIIAQLRVLERYVKESEDLVNKYKNDTMLQISYGVYKMELKQLKDELDQLKKNEHNPVHSKTRS